MKTSDEIDVDNIVDKYGDMINRIIYRKLKSKEDTEDTRQEVFIKYVRYINSGKRFNSEEHEKCWLIRVSLCLCYNKLKYNEIRKTVPLQDDFGCDLDLSNDNLVSFELNKLDKKYKETVELFYMDQLKISEISKILKISESNVKTRLKRARDKIKIIIKKGENMYGKI